MQRTAHAENAFRNTETTANKLLRIIGGALPETAGRQKVAVITTVIDVLSRVPVDKFFDLQIAMDDFQRMTSSDKQDVLSDIRRKITELIIG